MKNYVVTEGPAKFGPGTVLRLDAAQYGRRRHALEKAGDGVYRTLAPVEFKTGEKLGLEGAPPKALAEIVAAAESPAGQAAVKKAKKAA